MFASVGDNLIMLPPDFSRERDCKALRLVNVALEILVEYFPGTTGVRRVR